MGRFNPCLGKTACTEGGTHCLACGRGFEEIERTRELIAGLARLAVEMGYENVEDFADYVAKRITRKVAHDRGAETDAVDRGF